MAISAEGTGEADGSFFAAGVGAGGSGSSGRSWGWSLGWRFCRSFGRGGSCRNWGGRWRWSLRGGRSWRRRRILRGCFHPDRNTKKQ